MSHAEAWRQSSHDIFREIDNESGDFSIINRYGVVLIKESLLFLNTTYQRKNIGFCVLFVGHSWFFYKEINLKTEATKKSSIREMVSTCLFYKVQC